MKELENYIYEKYVKPLVVIKNNEKIIFEEDLNKLELSEKEKKVLFYVIREKNIKIFSKKVSKSEKSALVINNNYGDIEGNGLSFFDLPKIAIIQYDGDVVVYEDYTQLQAFLEEDFIPKNMEIKQQKGINGELESILSIQYNKIVKLKLSEKEVKYVVDYLCQKGIRIGGFAQGLDGQIENYDYCRTYKTSALPQSFSKEEQLQKFLAFKDTNDPKIREQLILANMRLVRYRSWEYNLKYNIAREEIEQYGYEGLIYAVDHFDPTLGFAFSNYALKCIDGIILNGIHKEYYCQKSWIIDYLKLKKFVEKEEGTTIEQDPSLISDIVDLLIEYNKISFYKREELIRKIQIFESISLESISEQEEYIDFPIPDDIFFKYIFTNSLKEDLKKVLKLLMPRERKLLILRYGLEDGVERTLIEVGKIMGLSRSRVGEIISRAKWKLRHLPQVKQMKDYLDIKSDESLIDTADVTYKIYKKTLKR